MNHTYTLLIEKSADGYYAEVPGVEGVYAQGDSENEVIANIKEVLTMTLEDMKKRGEKVPSNQIFPTFTFSTVSVVA